MILRIWVHGVFVMCCMMVWPHASLAKKKSQPQNDPVVHHVPDTVGFPGDELVIKGEGLDGKRLKFLVGNKQLKVVAATSESATVRLPKKVKTGPLRLKAGRTKIETDVTITALAIPVIKKIPATAAKGGKLRVRGKGFSEVSSWKLGTLALTPDESAPNTDTEITLEIPVEAPNEATLAAHLSGRSFPAKKRIRLGVPPVISHVMYFQTGDRKYPVRGHLEGKHLIEESTVLWGRKKAAKTRFRNRDGKTTLEFQFKQKLPKKTFTLVAANGPFQSEPYELDGKKQGFSVAEADLKTVLFREPSPLKLLSQAHLEKEIAAINGRVEYGCHQRGVTLRKKSSPAKLAAANGECAEAMLNAMLWARYYQGTICQRMGKSPGDAQMNANIAPQLEKVSAMMKSISQHTLAEIWGDVTPKMLKGGALKKLRLGNQIDLMEQVVESRDFAWKTCDGRVYGPDNKSAKSLVDFDTEALLKKAFPIAFKRLWDETGDPGKFEKQLAKPLRVPNKEMSEFWKQVVLKHYVAFQETIDAFCKAFMAGDLEAWANFYADNVLLEDHSELLKPRWGIVKEDMGRSAQTVSKSVLMGAYQRFMNEVGADKWQEAFGKIPADNISVKAEADIQQLTIRAANVDDTMHFNFKYNESKKKWEIVAEQTDY